MQQAVDPVGELLRRGLVGVDQEHDRPLGAQRAQVRAERLGRLVAHALLQRGVAVGDGVDDEIAADADPGRGRARTDAADLRAPVKARQRTHPSLEAPLLGRPQPRQVDPFELAQRPRGRDRERVRIARRELVERDVTDRHRGIAELALMPQQPQQVRLAAPATVLDRQHARVLLEAQQAVEQGLLGDAVHERVGIEQRGSGRAHAAASSARTRSRLSSTAGTLACCT